MTRPYHALAVFVSLAIYQQSAVGADTSTELTPAELIVGKWQDRAEPDDAVLEFFRDGKWKITEVTPERSIEVGILWKITKTLGNACIVVITYDVKDQKTKPSTWLIAFDGKDTYATQPMENKIVFMKRKK